MILIVTNEGDLTSDYVVLELKRRKLEFQRFNSETIARSEVLFDPERGEDAWSIQIDNRELDFARVTAAYFRRPGSPDVTEAGLDPGVREYCNGEWAAMLISAFNSLGDRWLNSPMAIAAAENKPKQLSIAHKLGFSVPDTIVSNNFDRVQEFQCAEQIVAKPLREALVESNEQECAIFTTRLPNLVDADKSSVAFAPVIYQHEIQKKFDLRVTVIGKATYAAEIHSQKHEDTTTDWRRNAQLDLVHKPHELPRKLQVKCIHFVHALGLRYGALDFVVDPSGKYWFLEINPNGQWAWIENQTGMPLTKAIVDELEAISLCPRN